ncbi:MAG: tRNA threonylcarbamoyladenosine biosynthesis protein TsaE [Cyclobacteriaceae bacterium]|jgi:tRNA threonylcarbamoyladenosine biosynthesis protein TsaE
MTYDLSAIDEVADHLLSIHSTSPVWCFVGEMGAGKTTLIKQICKKLGVTETLSSPTFSIINQYEGFEGKDIYHFDFYRIEEDAEVIQLGVEDLFYSGAFCFIEWPDRVIDYLPDRYLQICINLVSPTERQLKLIEHD